MKDNLSNVKVLLIDDGEETRVMVKNMLYEMGITQIFEATDGKQGMQFLDMSFDFVDLILCDWNMPKMDGISLLKQLRSVDLEFPFLMITGRGDMGSVVEAKGAGVTAYIHKPFSLVQLEAKMRVICSRMELA